MAIPFNLPSDECSLEQYRSIHQLLLDVINLLRALLNSEIQPPPSPSPNSPLPAYGSYFTFPTPPSSVPNSPSPFSPNATTTSAFILPDVVASAVPSAVANDLRNFWNSQMNMANPVVSQPEVEPPQIVEPLVRRGSTASPSSKLLRKRKRARLNRKKKCSECSDVHCNFAKCTASTTYERYHKIPKTTGTVCSSCCNAHTNDAGTIFSSTHDHKTEYCCEVPTKRETEFYPSFHAKPTNQCKSPTWMYVGEELKRMTDGFRNPTKKVGNMDEMDSKGNGLISQCGRTVFAAALLVLGWKLLKQN